MITVRSVLSVFTCIFGYTLYQTVTGDFSLDEGGFGAKIVISLILGTFFIWALLMLIGYSWHARKDANGVICLTQGHPLLFIAEITNEYPDGKIKPCPLYWKVSLLTIFIWVIIAVGSYIAYQLLIAPFYGNFGGLIALGSVVFLVLLFLFGDYLYRHNSIIASLFRIIGATVFCIFVLPSLWFLAIVIGWDGLFVIGSVLFFIAVGAGVLYILHILLRLSGILQNLALLVTPGYHWLSKRSITIKNRWVCPPIQECQESKYSS